MRAIDADKLIDDLYELKYTKESPSIILTPAGQEIYNSGVESAIGTILGAPTIDAVPMVRCKDCTWYSHGYCNRFDDDVMPDDFCSRGHIET